MDDIEEALAKALGSKPYCLSCGDVAKTTPGEVVLSDMEIHAEIMCLRCKGFLGWVILPIDYYAGIR